MDTFVGKPCSCEHTLTKMARTHHVQDFCEMDELLCAVA